LSHTSSPFLLWLFEDGGLTNYLSRLVPILASQVVRTIGVSHQCLAKRQF
jgi:hypothetical protein